MGAVTKASERLFETNYCVAAALHYRGYRLVWLSPTQLREASLGYDTLLPHSNGVEVIQFKVPKKRLDRPRSYGPKPCLRIELPHSQVKALRKRAGRSRFLRAHFVFPRVIEIREYFDAAWDVLDISYSLNAADLKGIGAPERLSRVHLGDFRPSLNRITLHSEPVDVEVAPTSEGWAPDNEPMGRQGTGELVELLHGLSSELPTARIGLYFSAETSLREVLR